ncbi:hypothetical protein OPV22_032574 [Ensete ventricosum]|uniref:Uncharacterized protein n=1 Tax=Ensete ventricosum TaxID=4639 RepID=A0AAV8PYN2_ENSVE|nr:hypothetical protein OPV22_032574 [Ensete ventricosum]RWV81261.1 hypothetical protein GW17_00057337 [Ensete ventricosum]RWW59344.1 hypothetical protein BHE74_00033764 [Ensete ventricosum]
MVKAPRASTTVLPPVPSFHTRTTSVGSLWCLLYMPSSASKPWLHRGLGMFWRRKEKKASAMYERLSTSAGRRVKVAEVPTGHVPVLVGMDIDGAVERFVVPLRLFQDPWMATLLDMSAQEFGYRHHGILRIPCDVDHFRRVIGTIDKAR